MIDLLDPDQLPMRARRVHLEPPGKRATYCGTELRPGLMTAASTKVANCPQCLRVYDVELSNRSHTPAPL